MSSAAPARAKKKPAASVLSRESLAVIHVVALEKGKRYYKQADAALEQLLLQSETGDIITLPAVKPVPTKYRGKKYRLHHKGNSFPVGQTARCFELREVPSLS